MNQLLITPNPKKYESWRGYILRLAEENVIDKPKRMLYKSTIPLKETRTQLPDISYIIEITGKPEDLLDPIFPRLVKTNNFQFFGNEINKEYFRINSPALCTECIKELEYIPARWDIEMLNVCHIHRRQLITQCPKCRRKLAWYRKGLMVCNCGVDFSDHIGQLVSQEEVNYAFCLASIIEKTPDSIDFTKTSIPQRMHLMKLNNFLSFSNFLGYRHLVNINETFGERRFGSRRAYKVAVKILNNWNVEFKELIRNSKTDSKSSDISVRKSYKNFWQALKNCMPEGADSKFVIDNFMQHVNSMNEFLLIDKKMKVSSEIKDAQRYVGIKAAAKILNKMPSTIRKMVMNDKLAHIVHQSKDGHKRYYIDTHQIMQKLPNRLGELSLRKAAAYTQLPVSVLKLAREQDIYESNYQTIYPHTWAIPDLDNFAIKIVNLAQSEDTCKCLDLIELNKAFKNLKLGSDQSKVEVLVAILNGKITIFGEGNITTVRVCKSQLYKYIRTSSDCYPST